MDRKSLRNLGAVQSSDHLISSLTFTQEQEKKILILSTHQSLFIFIIFIFIFAHLPISFIFILIPISSPSLLRRALIKLITTSLKQIYFPQGSSVWYGRVTPHEVHAIVQHTILGGKVLPQLLRGGLGIARPGCASLLDW